MPPLSRLKVTSATLPGVARVGSPLIAHWAIKNEGGLPRRAVVSVVDEDGSLVGRSPVFLAPPQQEQQGTVEATFQTVGLRKAAVTVSIAPLPVFVREQDRKVVQITITAQPGAGGVVGPGAVVQPAGPGSPAGPGGGAAGAQGGGGIFGGGGILGGGFFGGGGPGGGGPGAGVPSGAGPGRGGRFGDGPAPTPAEAAAAKAAAEAAARVAAQKAAAEAAAKQKAIDDAAKAAAAAAEAAIANTAGWTWELGPDIDGPPGSGTRTHKCANGVFTVTGEFADEARSAGETGSKGWSVIIFSNLQILIKPPIPENTLHMGGALDEAIRQAKLAFQGNLDGGNGKAIQVYIRSEFYNAGPVAWIWDRASNVVTRDYTGIFNEDGSLLGDGPFKCVDPGGGPSAPAAPAGTGRTGWQVVSYGSDGTDTPDIQNKDMALYVAWLESTRGSPYVTSVKIFDQATGAVVNAWDQGGSETNNLHKYADGGDLLDVPTDVQPGIGALRNPGPVRTQAQNNFVVKVKAATGAVVSTENFPDKGAARQRAADIANDVASGQNPNNDIWIELIGLIAAPTWWAWKKVMGQTTDLMALLDESGNPDRRGQ